MTRHTLAILVGSLIVSTFATANAQSNEPDKSQTEIKGNIEERILGQLKPGYAEGSLAFSPDGTRFAYVTGRQGSQRMITGRQTSPSVVFCSVPQFSPRLNHLYYCAVKRGADGQLKVELITEDKAIPTDFTPGSGWFYFSPDGRHYAAVGGKVDGEGKPAGVTVIVDGEVSGNYRDVSAPVFSKDGTKCAFAVLNEDDSMSILVNSKVIRTFKSPEVPCSYIFNTSISGPNLPGMVQVAFLEDDGIACLIRDAKGWSIYIREKRVATYRLLIWGGPNGPIHTLTYDGADDDPAIMANSFVTAKAAATVAWWARNGGKGSPWRMLRNGESADEFVWHGDIQRYPPVLSPDGKHIAYYTTTKKENGEGDEYYLIHDGRKLGPYGNVWAVAFSADGNHLAFAAKPTGDEEWHCYIDGKQVGPAYTSLYATEFCPDGAQVCWAAKRNGAACAVMNGTVVATGDSMAYGPVCAENASPIWVLRRGDDLVRISEIGIIDTEAYVKEGTEALVGEVPYRYNNQKWCLIDENTAESESEKTSHRHEMTACAIAVIDAQQMSAQDIGFPIKEPEEVHFVVIDVRFTNQTPNAIAVAFEDNMPELSLKKENTVAQFCAISSWLPMRGGVGPYATEVGLGGKHLDGKVSIDKDTFCGWLAIDKPKSKTGDHLRIPTKAVTLNLGRSEAMSLKLLFMVPPDVTSGSLIIPRCIPKELQVRW